MSDVIIRECQEGDDLNSFFASVVRHTFEQNGIGSLEEDILEEIADKAEFYHKELNREASFRRLFVAKISEEIIGTIAYGESNELMNKLSDGKTKKIPEIGCLLIKNSYQKRGLSNILLRVVFNKLLENGAKTVAFDCGYGIAQSIWIKKFGQASYVFKNYWGENSHHMIWIIDIENALHKLKFSNY